MKTKKRFVAKVIGAIPVNGLWRVRLKAPYVPFYLDSSDAFVTRRDAEAEAEKWRKRKVVIEVEK